MGNNNSGHLGVSQPPPPWTQSLPRDAHRQKKYGAINQGTKVLPERIPGQRLKPTENGRNLQVQGTITTKKMSEVSHRAPSFANHHSSMTALNHNLPVSFFPHTSGSITDLRFGNPPSMSFVSEPDLRGNSPSSNKSLPSQQPHSVIFESSAKGKIKSKKRNKAPMPPKPLKSSISYPLDSRISSPSPIDNWSPISSPDPKNLKAKPRKMGLFKKRSESRMAKYSSEDDSPTKYLREDEIIQGEERLRRSQERSITPVPFRLSSKKDLKERARSLDNLQHELRMSLTPKELATSMHSLKIVGSIPPDSEYKWYDIDNQNHRYSDSSDSRKCSTIERESRKKTKAVNRASSTLDREPKIHKRMSNVERRTYEKQLEERRLDQLVASSANNEGQKAKRPYRSIPDYRRTSSSSSSHRETVQNEPKDEWDKAEEEWLQKKENSENLQRDILNAAKNLRKTSTSPVQKCEQNSLQIPNNSTDDLKSLEIDETDDVPKTFFFGMEPQSLDNKNTSHTNSALVKLNETEGVQIIGNVVEYSRHSLRPQEKKKGFERDNWNKSLDYRERNQIKDKELQDTPDAPEDTRKLNRKMDRFVATIERAKSKRIPSPEELSNSITRKGDGGYHSRQNSGSFHIDTEGSDEDNLIRMNLRPILPRRQLELPRFSPNAAWRSLGAENSVRQKDTFSDGRTNDDVFNISEDRIHRSTLPTAPSRGTGEKSADSGISGDAGSPGPIQEFEPLTPEKIKSSCGPLAVSSPVASTRLENKRTWTPAQDLDDNSLEDVGDNRKTSMDQDLKSLPKLTSRTNMFNKSYIDIEEEEDDKNYGHNEVQKSSHQPRYFDENILTHASSGISAIPTDDNHKNSRFISSQREDTKESDTDNIMQGDTWRDNWSMSRSIPNSLNTCDEPESTSNSSRHGRTKSESRMSSGNKQGEKMSRPITPSYLQAGNNGHIMYLPEYKSYHYNKENNPEQINGTELNNDRTNRLNLEKKLSSDRDIDRSSPDCHKSNHQQNEELIHRLMGKKGKKFTYQSTVRILENKIIERQLSKDAEEKEKLRLSEMEAMLKVEEEFQKKREREKKRLKKQLKLYQQEHQKNNKKIDEVATSSLEDDKSSSPHSYTSSPNDNRKVVPHLIERPASQQAIIIGPPQPLTNGHTSSIDGSYQSLPVELNDHSKIFETSGPLPGQNGIFSGLKKWVKSKKEPRSGYHSDASSVTVTSVSRQNLDGPPAASSSGRRKFDIRSEIIAASRYRNGVVYLDRDSDSHSNRSPSTSVTSKESNRRPFTPDSKRTISPDSRKSLSSEPCPLTQELPELRQEQRQYREYRKSTKKFLLPSIRNSSKLSPATHNYRRDFVLGNISSKSGTYHYDDNNRNPRYPIESRKSYANHESSKRCSSADPLGRPDLPVRSHHHYSSTKPPIIPIPNAEMYNVAPAFGARVHHRVPKGYSSSPIDVNSARFAQSLITPFNPSKGYRPVAFSPVPGKILSVT